MNSRIREVLVGAIAVAGVLTSPVPREAAAYTVTIDFSVGTTGVLGTSTFTHGGTGLVAQGMYWNGSAWITSNAGLSLVRRNEGADDKGLGVCSPGEAAGGCGVPGNGDRNEISNQLNPELIMLSLPAGFKWVSAHLSSLDTNDAGAASGFERGIVFAAANGLPSLGSPGLNVTATKIQYVTDGDAEFDVALNGAFAASPFLAFEAFDWLNSSNTNNDYLIASVIIEAPEPASLALLGAGMIGLGIARRRRKG